MGAFLQGISLDLEDLVEEEFAFFLVWLADEIFIGHSKYGFVPLFLAGFSFLIFCSCSSTKQVHTVPVENLHHDTLYINKEKFDSIYIDNTHLIDRGGDTVYIKEKQIEYRFRLLR